jgi:hypothetical protein
VTGVWRPFEAFVNLERQTGRIVNEGIAREHAMMNSNERCQARLSVDETVWARTEGKEGI